MLSSESQLRNALSHTAVSLDSEEKLTSVSRGQLANAPTPRAVTVSGMETERRLF